MNAPPIGSGALGRAAPWAVVSDEVVQTFARELGEASDDVRGLVDRGLARFDERQPILASYVAECLSELGDSTASALGHFLCVASFLLFDRAFGDRVGGIDDAALAAAREALVTENELSEREPHLRLSAAASVATLQPHVAAFVDRHLTAALDAGADKVSEEALGAVFGTVLVVVVALSRSVQPPDGSWIRRWES